MKSLKQTRIGLGVVGLALLSFSSCKKEGNANLNPESQITFSVKGDLTATSNSTNGVSLPTGTASATINWTEGTANVTKFEFEAKKGLVEKEIEVKGLTNINLFAINPEVVKSVIDTGTYREISLKLVLSKSTNGTIPLAFKGTFAGTDGATPVEISVNEDLTLKVEVENVKIDAATDLKATFVLGVNKILQGIGVAELNVATKTAGKVLISNTSNTALYNKIKTNLQNIAAAKMESEHRSGKQEDGPGHG
ncbi:hypothetical protein [Pedobacter sandarakinus]|uniref:hypothetical protein n=1 Tax=Pedobacter sandarakinus TaxID=353156 RepID=UPI002245AD55|nr:hypothetical protein [Pedobacter sandarakinus]MCX2575292.1 hypothetical protein [Pedobacter sandarakinus]